MHISKQAGLAARQRTGGPERLAEGRRRGADWRKQARVAHSSPFVLTLRKLATRLKRLCRHHLTTVLPVRQELHIILHPEIEINKKV